MSENRYVYGVHRNLSPAELFVFVGLDQTRKQLGLDDLASAAAILLGQNDVPVPGKFAGAVSGTSVVSLTARRLLPFRVAVRLPTLIKAGTGGLRIVMVRNLGAFVGRTIPLIGTIMLASDAFMIVRHTVFFYNRLVKPEDRLAF